MLAGGQSLVPALNMRLLHRLLLLDVNRVPSLDTTSLSGTLRVGMTVRRADPRLLAHPILAARAPARQPRSRATRGTIWSSPPDAAELPLALLLCSGTAIVASARGRREIRGEELFLGPYTTALTPDELLVETTWPALREGEGFAFDELTQRRGDYALCMAAARVRKPTCASSSRRSHPPRPCSRSALSVRARRRAGRAVGLSPRPCQYLRHLVRVLVDRVVARATERAA